MTVDLIGEIFFEFASLEFPAILMHVRTTNAAKSMLVRELVTRQEQQSRGKEHGRHRDDSGCGPANLPPSIPCDGAAGAWFPFRFSLSF